MIKITDQDKKKLAEDGFVIVKGYHLNEEIVALTNALTSHGQYFFGNEFYLGSPIKPEYTNKIGEYYKTLRYLPELLMLASSNKIISLMKNLGLERPCIMNANNIRVDTPDNRALFHWHQDTTYLLGSINAITVWIALTGANRQRGSIELIPGSHKSGFFPFFFPNGTPAQKSYVSPRDLYLLEEPIGDPLMVEVDPGDLVIFHQMLLHRSTPNFSNYPRITVQLRYSDFNNKEFKKAGYPFGDQTNIAHVPHYLSLLKDLK